MGTTFGDQQAHNLDGSAQPPGYHNTIVGSPVGASVPQEQSWPSDALADLHLSGSDPRMFPGIFTRGHRSGSSRNLAQAAEDGKHVFDDVPEADDT